MRRLRCAGAPASNMLPEDRFRPLESALFDIEDRHLYEHFDGYSRGLFRADSAMARRPRLPASVPPAGASHPFDDVVFVIRQSKADLVVRSRAANKTALRQPGGGAMKLARRQFLYLAATAALPDSFVATSASGQTNFPNRFIKIVNPLPSGSGPDVVIRLIGEKLTGFFGQQVIVENRPGGGGAIAAQAVAATPPDGYTILLAVASIFAVLPAQKDKIRVDINRALTPIGMVGDGPLYVAVPPTLGVTSFPEFIALAKSKPGQIFVGTNTAGSLPHFAGLALEKRGNIPITVVPYNQGGTLGAITDILGGRIHAVIEAMFGLRGFVQSGDLKVIGVMSLERDPDFPDVQTVAASVPGFSAIGWLSLAAPAGTPEYAVGRLNEGLRHALEDSNIKQRLSELGLRPMIRTPVETKTFIESEQNFWWPIVREYESR